MLLSSHAPDSSKQVSKRLGAADHLSRLDLEAKCQQRGLNKHKTANRSNTLGRNQAQCPKLGFQIKYLLQGLPGLVKHVKHAILDVMEFRTKILCF